MIRSLAPGGEGCFGSAEDIKHGASQKLCLLGIRMMSSPFILYVVAFKTIKLWSKVLTPEVPIFLGSPLVDSGNPQSALGCVCMCVSPFHLKWPITLSWILRRPWPAPTQHHRQFNRLVTGQNLIFVGWLTCVLQSHMPHFKQPAFLDYGSLLVLMTCFFSFRVTS